MEIVIYFIAALIGFIALFLIIEYPYHFIGMYIFISLYKFNVELPGPLDLRGLLSLVLFFRLVAFDKENLNFILKDLFTNYLFLLILIFDIFFISVTYINSGTYKTPIRLFIFQFIGLVLGALSVYRGYSMKVFFSAIVTAGMLATIDLIYSFGITSQLFVRRVIDVLFKSEYSTDLNHNFFGMLNGIALVSTYVMLVSKKLNLKTAIFLLLVFGIGVFLSTSRTTLLTAFVTILIGTLMFPRDRIDVKNILVIGIKGFVFLSIVLGAFVLTLNILKVDSKFTDKIHYRLIEEPMNLLEGKTSKFRGNSQYLKQGSASWRFNKALRDLEKYTSLPLLPQLFGYGFNGYFNVGEKEFDRYDQKIQIISHNGLVTLIIERGIIGFMFFFIINILLIKATVRVFRDDITVFPFYVVVIFMLIYTFGAAPLILDRFGYILMGGIVGQVLHHKHFLINNSSINS